MSRRKGRAKPRSRPKPRNLPKLPITAPPAAEEAPPLVPLADPGSIGSDEDLDPADTAPEADTAPVAEADTAPVAVADTAPDAEADTAPDAEADAAPVAEAEAEAEAEQDVEPTDAAPEPEVVAPPARPQSPATSLTWARIRSAAHPRFSRAQMLASVLVAALGFALVAQITQHGDQRLTGLRPNELVQILDNLNDRRDRLNSEKTDLEAERRQLLSGTAGSQAAIAAAQSRLDALGILAGTVPAEGPGIQVTIRDPSGAVLPPRLLDLVQELRDAGAEAIQIGSARVVANTAFTDVQGGGVAVNGIRQKSPYVVRAIGDSQTMSTAMQIPGGAIASLPPGVTGSVVEQDVVQLTALRPVPRPRYAQPATTATPTR